MVTRREFAKALLKEIRAPITQRNMVALISWMQAEGGHAKFNPLNTTHEWPLATEYNWIGVKNYANLEDGVAATAETLNYGADRGLYGYDAIRHRLRHSSHPKWTLSAVEKSTWGTGGVAIKCIKWVKKSFEAYAEQPIG